MRVLSTEHVGLVLASDGVCDIATGDDIAAVVGEVSGHASGIHTLVMNERVARGGPIKCCDQMMGASARA